MSHYHFYWTQYFWSGRRTFFLSKRKDAAEGSKFPSLKKQLIFLFMCSIRCCSGNWVFWSRRWWRLKRGKTRWTTTSSGRSHLWVKTINSSWLEIFVQIIKNFDMALSLKYREVDQVLQKVLHGTEVHEERWVMKIMGSSFSDLKSHKHISRKYAPKNRHQSCLFISGGELVWLTLTTLLALLLEWCSSMRLLTRKPSRRQRRWSNWSQKRSGNKILEIYFFQGVFVNLCS